MDTPEFPRLPEALERELGIEMDLRDPERPVILKPLTPKARQICDEKLLPIYAEIIEKFEAPRDSMTVADCGERLVNLEEYLPSIGVKVLFSKRPFHEACGSFAGKPRIFWVRKEVARRIGLAAQFLNNDGLMMRIEDCYRPPEVQQGLFRRRYKLVREQFAEWSLDQVMREVSAKTAISPFRAAHMAGGAVDFTIVDSKGDPLPLGNEYPGGGAAAVLDFPYLTAEEIKTRELFWSAASAGELWPYIGEDWHVSFGDGLSNLWTGENVIKYGPLKGFKSDGELIPYPEAEMRKVFSLEGR